MRSCRTWRARLGVAVLLGLLGSAPSARAAVSVNVGSVTGSPGSTMTVFVTLSATAGEQVAATDTTIGFEAATPVSFVQCTPNPSFAINQCALQPTGCTPGADCQQSECIILPFGGTIPSGSVLYVCNVDIASNAASGEYALSCSSVGVFDSADNSLNPQCTGGYVEVVPPTPTPTPGPGVSIGCQIAAVGQSDAGWPLLFPAAALLWWRRRR